MMATAKRNILHIIDTTGPGGAETVFIDLLSGLDADLYNATVLIRGKGWVYEELQRRGYNPLIVDAKGSFNWRYILKLTRIIKENRIDIIQSHLLGSNVYASLAGLLTFTPVISVFHGGVDVSSNERFKRIKFSAINFGSKKIVTVSDNLKKELIERTSLNPKKVQVIYNGIDVKKFDVEKSNDLREKYQWHHDEVIVGCLGNLRPAKGYDVLLHAAALIKQKELPYRFLIAGQGKTSLEQELYQIQQELDVGDIVKFIGFCDEPEIFLSNLDVFLLSSTSEGFSIATIQAMASKLAVLATRSGGPEEILNSEENGLLIRPGDPVAIVDGLNKLHNDEAARNKMIKLARKDVEEKFDISAMIRRYQKLYQ